MRRVFKESTFKEMLSLTGLGFCGSMTSEQSYKKAAEFLCISKRTVQRYVCGDSTPSGAVIKLLELRYNGYIPQEGEWKGHIINSRDELVAPNNEILTPLMIKKLWLDRWLKQAQQMEIGKLKVEIEQLKSIGMHDKTEAIKEMANRILGIVESGNMRAVPEKAKAV